MSPLDTIAPKYGYFVFSLVFTFLPEAFLVCFSFLVFAFFSLFFPVGFGHYDSIIVVSVDAACDYGTSISLS